MTFLARLLGRDSLHELSDAMINLELLADAEAQIAEFYRLCAGAVEKDAKLWNHLADQELQHADKARQMLGRITRNPELYKPGVSFSTVTIRLFDVEMQGLVERMNRGRISADQLFAIALEIEESAVELNYGKLVKTDDAAFNMLAHQIDSESAEHKSAISLRANAASARSTKQSA